MKSRFKSKQLKKTHRTLSELDFIDLWSEHRKESCDPEYAITHYSFLKGQQRMEQWITSQSRTLFLHFGEHLCHITLCNYISIARKNSPFILARKPLENYQDERLLL